MFEARYGHAWSKAGMDSEQKCVEGFNMGQTSNPRRRRNGRSKKNYDYDDDDDK